METMTAKRRAGTTYLLTCASIGVTGALLLAPANWASTALFTVWPTASIGLAGLWILPSVVALRLLQRPGAGLLVGLLAGLVLVPVSGFGLTSLLTNLWWAFFAEVGFLATGYRAWRTWQHYVGAAIAGVVYPVTAAGFFGLWAQPLWSQMLFFALCVGSLLLATWCGIAIADALRRGGVGLARASRAR